MLKKTSILLFITWTFFLGFKTLAQTTYIDHYDVRDGLPSNNCFFSYQDTKGYIWVGTDAGVSRFDGKYFRNFTITDGLPDNQILQIKEDKMGRLWFLSFSGKLSYHYNGKIFNNTNSPLLRKLNITEIVISFFEDSKGRLWFGTNKNLLYLFDGKKLLKFVSRDLKHQFINATVFEDNLHRIWIMTQEASMTYKDGSFYRVPSMPLALSYKTVTYAPDKKLIYLDKRGLQVFQGNVKSVDLDIPSNMLNTKQGFMHASESELWLANNEGVFKIRNGKKAEHFIPNIPASQVIKDKFDNMWFTTSNGIYMLPSEENRMYILDRSHGLSSNYIKSLTKDKNTRVWLGLDKGLLNVVDFKNTSIKEVEVPAIGIQNDIKQLYFDSAHAVVYFSTEQSLGRIQNIYAKMKPELLQEAAHAVLAIKNFALSKKNELAIATASGVFLINNPLQEFKFHALKIKHGKRFYENRAYTVFYDQQDKLWFSNTEGLNASEGLFLERSADQMYFSDKRINDIKALDSGTIVVATDGYGLAYIRDGHIIKKVTVDDGLADNICKKLFVDGKLLWVITNNGINNISINKDKIEIQAYEYTNALLKNDVNDLYIGATTAYFATNNGLVYFPKKAFKRKAKAPQVIVSGILNNNNILQVQDTLTSLGPSKNNITFIYSAIDFQKQDLIYRFRLNPEDNWTETRNRRLEFSSLSPGAYTFEISTKSNNTDWSNPTKIRFKVEAHFWQHTWFIILLLVAASFTFYKIAVIITKWQKNQEQKQLVLKHKILILEQRALLAMMNPHFIFNVMNSIQHYINTKDTSSANKILTGFARLIRKNLEICTKSFITLEEELEYLNLYLGLEKKRFGDKFSYKVNIDPGIDKEEVFIPSMLLQPFVENAIWHGLMPKEEGGQVEITMQLEDQAYLLIYIIDDGIGIENSRRMKAGSHSSKGMSLTQERIQLLNQTESMSIQMSIRQRGESGTIVTIKIPI